VSRQRVLIVEDEPEIAELIKFHVDREGFESRIVSSGRTALDTIDRDRPDLVLLDLMLPDLDGLEVCRRLKQRDRTRDLPVLIVSARGEEADVVAGIELGAEDYVTKPFSPRILMARVKNVLRRTAPATGGAEPADGTIAVAGGEIVIDPDRHRVSVAGKPIDLTVTEFGILRFLAARPGFVKTRDQIIRAVHGSNIVLSSRTVDVHVTALRRKLGPWSHLIETVRGVGYRLSEGPGVDDE
jgi:two-component system phosphate regulon response regulator PhoB